VSPFIRSDNRRSSTEADNRAPAPTTVKNEAPQLLCCDDLQVSGWTWGFASPPKKQWIADHYFPALFPWAGLSRKKNADSSLVSADSSLIGIL
jgi:hypothetical protein